VALLEIRKKIDTTLYYFCFPLYVVVTNPSLGEDLRSCCSNVDSMSSWETPTELAPGTCPLREILPRDRHHGAFGLRRQPTNVLSTNGVLTILGSCRYPAVHFPMAMPSCLEPPTSAYQHPHPSHASTHTTHPRAPVSLLLYSLHLSS